MSDTAEVTKKTRVCVIGAGWYGIVAAKTYLQVEPTIDITLLESNPTPGGTWSRDRVHPELRAQQPYGVYEYADLPLPVEGIADPYNTFIPSEKLHEYILSYATKFGVLDKIRCNSPVRKLERDGSGKRWRVWVGEAIEAEEYDKVIIATGLTSRPNLPDNLNLDSFTSRWLHSRDVGAHYDFLTSPSCKTIVVYGGGKSALDAAYLGAKHGKKVEWIIRPDNEGNGASGIYPAEILGQNTNDVVGSRWGASQHPSLDLMERKHWSYGFFHAGGNRLGYWFHWWWWGYLGRWMDKWAGYEKSENMKKLRPLVKERAAFWANVPAAIANHPDTLEHIHSGKNITVHRATITSVSGNTVETTAGAFPADALILATGWKTTEPIYSPELAAELGVPQPLETYPDDLRQKWEDLDTRAEAEILKLFPRLHGAPEDWKSKKPMTETPYRLYRNIVPTELAAKHDRSITFVGAVACLNTAIASEAVALWAVAWMAEHKGGPVWGPHDSFKSKKEVEWEVAMRNAFARRRYQYAGTSQPYTLYEYQPMVDKMMMELGVNPYRKGGGWWQELFGTYFPKDYKGFVEEWIVKKDEMAKLPNHS